MRESYDKCLTPPIARFMVLNKCPVPFSRSTSPSPVTRKVAEEVERRKAAMADAGFRVAWVPAANLHLTLRFLGSVGEELVEGVTGACRRVAARHPPFEARRAGSARSRRCEKPSVLWVGVEAPPALAALQRDVEAAMVELGFEKEERAYHPHVTVGRVKESRGSGDGALEGRRARRRRARSAKSLFTRARPAQPAPSTSRARGSLVATR